MIKKWAGSCVAVSATFALVAGFAAGSAAASQRTFVASFGVDTNACSLASPCRTFTQALTQTPANGEIIALDSAGYGPVTISQSVSIVAAPGAYAGITASGGSNGIDVTGGTTVVLRGLSIGSLGAGNIGILANYAELSVDGCTISGFLASGIAAGGGSGLYVRDTTFRGNNWGIQFGGSGATATVSRTVFESNAVAVFVSSGAKVSISDSVFENNQSGVSVQSLTSFTTTSLTISSSVINGGPLGVAIAASAASGATVILQASGNTISHANLGIQVSGDPSASAFGSISRNTISNAHTGIVVTGSSTHVTIVGNTLSNNESWGILASLGATAIVSNNAVSGNWEGILAQDTGTTITTAGNVVADNNPGAGFHNDAPASFMSRGDNILTGNGGGGPQTVGAITPIGGF